MLVHTHTHTHMHMHTNAHVVILGLKQRKRGREMKGYRIISGEREGDAGRHISSSSRRTATGEAKRPPLVLSLSLHSI